MCGVKGILKHAMLEESLEGRLVLGLKRAFKQRGRQPLQTHRGVRECGTFRELDMARACGLWRAGGS